MKDLVKTLPKQAGVYLFKDENGSVLYVGKAKNLKSRVGSYFTDRHLDRPWIAVMIGLIRDVETIVVNNELEALILEANLITQYQPKFNVKLTDDKAYPFIKLTISEAFPRFQVVRKRTVDKAKYFGPYLSAWSARLTCEFLRRLYGVHISNQPIIANHDRPCLNCQLEGNSCPLARQIPEEAYALQVKKCIDFLNGKRQSLVKDLETRMKQASEQKMFELAAKLRDQLRAVRQVVSDQDITSSTIENFDTVAAAKSSTKSVVALLKVRDGQVAGQQQFGFDISVDQSLDEVVRQFFLTIYCHFEEVPKLIVLAEEIEDQAIIGDWLRSSFGQAIELRTAKRGEKADLVAIAQKNAETKLESQLLTSSNDYSGLIALKELIKLRELPSRIECIDISNLGSSEPVGATTCFIDGQPDKKEYRRYKIKDVEGQNDFAMIEEVVKRRLSDPTRPTPDLLVIDGGPEQLSSAVRALAQTTLQPKHILSLAKKPDRIFLPGKRRPVVAPRGSKALMLLARVRDETHRYVISFHRQRQRKKSLKTNQ